MLAFQQDHSTEARFCWTDIGAQYTEIQLVPAEPFWYVYTQLKFVTQ